MPYLKGGIVGCQQQVGGLGEIGEGPENGTLQEAVNQLETHLQNTQTHN